jgi:hypothetical protein
MGRDASSRSRQAANPSSPLYESCVGRVKPGIQLSVFSFCRCLSLLHPHFDVLFPLNA